MISKIFVALCAFSLLISFPSKNYDGDVYILNNRLKNDNVNNTDAIKYYSASQNTYSVTHHDSERTFTEDTQSFMFSTNTSIDDIQSIGDVGLVSFSVLNNYVYCNLKGLSTGTYINIDFYNENILIDSLSLYFAKSDDNIIFSSGLSLDVAKRNSGIELSYDLEYDDTNTIENYQSGFSRSIGATGSVSGVVQWTDEQGEVRPLAGARIRVSINGSWWSGETLTNELGAYSLSYQGIWYIGTGKPTVHIYAQNSLVKVHHGGTYVKSHEFTIGGNNTYSYTFSPTQDGDVGKAMMIFQGAKNFADHATQMNQNVPISFCAFKYPSNSTYYDGASNVHINSENPINDNFPETYAAWDVLGHEYAHHIQNVFNISQNPGGRHSIPINNIDEQFNNGYSLSEAKIRGHKLTWGEGWATYWSIVAQHSFDDVLKTIDTVGDTFYTSSNGFNYNLDAFVRGFGDADEQVIQRVLYKLYSLEVDNIDSFASGEENLWNIVVNYKPVTFHEFINDLYTEGYSKHHLGLLLGEYGIITTDLNISNIYYDALPVVEWSTWMGSANLRFNQFDLYFVDYYGDIITSIFNIPSYTDDCKYTLTESQWNSIFNSYGDSFGVYFVARQTDYYISGNYFSETFSFYKPSSFSSHKIQIKPNEWGFEGRYYFNSEIQLNENLRYSTLNRNNLVITTDRLRTGYIENSYINLSPRRENAGRAYLEMNFNRKVYSFMYSICLWSANENMNGIATLQIKDYLGNWSILTDLKQDINLTTKDAGLKRYSHYFPDGIYGIKFENFSDAVGSRNKGRLSIDDMVFGTNQLESNNNYFIKNYPKTQL